MPIMKLNKPARVMIDVDNCLLDNERGELNEAILGLLTRNKDIISSCALITGRDITGVSRTLNNQPNITSIILKANGLRSVEEKIKEVYDKEIVVCTTKDLVGENNKPGDYYSSYGPIEADILNASNRENVLKKLNPFLRGDLSWITDEELRNHANKTAKWDMDFDEMTSRSGYNQDLFDKGPQVKFYLKSLEASGADSVKIYIDDVPSKVINVAEENSEVIAVHNNVEMGKGYNEQALNFAISAANSNDKEESLKMKKDLIEAARKFEELSKHFDQLKELFIIDKKTSIGDFVRPLVKNEDWFKAVEEYSESLNLMITEYRAQEAYKVPKEIRNDFLKENYNEFIKSLKVVAEKDLSSDEELNRATALSFGGVGSQDVKKEMREIRLREESNAGVAKNLGNPEIGSRAVMEEQRRIKEQQALDEAMARSLDDEERVAGSRDVNQRKSQIESDGEFARQLARQLANKDFNAIRSESANLGARGPASSVQHSRASAMEEREVVGR